MASKKCLQGKLVTVKAMRATALILSLLVLLASWIGGAGLLEATVFDHLNFSKALMITVLALPFLTDLAVLGGAYRGLYRPLPSIVAQSLIQPIVRVLIIAGCLVIGQEFLALPVGVVIGSVVSWVVLQYQANQFLGTSSTVLAIPLAEIREVLSYSAPLSLAVMIAMATRMLDLIFIGYFRPPEDLGQYSVVLLMTQLVGLAPAALSQTLGTHVAAAYVQIDIEKVRNLQVEYAKLVALVSAPLFACILFWGDRVDLLLGDSYRLDWRVIGLAASTAALAGVTNGLGHTLGMTGYQNRELGIVVGGFIMQCIGSWMLIPAMGQLGAATASFVAVLTIWLARLWTINRKFGIVPIAAAIFLPFLLACALALCVYHSPVSASDRTIFNTAFACLTLVAAYAVSLMAFGDLFRRFYLLFRKAR